MIPVATVAEMQALDESYKANDIQKGFSLMQKAARIAFDLLITEILKVQKNGAEAKTIILCGKGNNGGDGLVLATYLIEQGYETEVFLFADPKDLKDEASLAYKNLEKLKKDPCTLIQNIDDLHSLQNIPSTTKHNFIIDAIYGLGYKAKEVNELLQVTANIVNSFQQAKTVIAIDSPSGIDNDTGFCAQAPIQANLTLAMGFPKLGKFFFPARAFLGLMMVGNLDYSIEEVQNLLQSKIFFVDRVKALFPARAINGSKYDHGYIANIAGSKNMMGAALLSSKAVYKAGAGLCKLYSENPELVLSSCPELITAELHGDSAKEILSDEKLDCISMGPGLGSNYKALVHSLVQESTKPLILDADAINAFVDAHDELKKHKAQIIITPHLGEYKRLFPGDIADDMNPIQLIDVLKKRAKEFNMTILLKGNPTLIVDPSQEAFILPYGNTGLATAGSGDVLTGLLAGFLAQSLKRQNKILLNSNLITQNAILAAYLHAQTAELISPEQTEFAIMASDILANFHRALKFSLN